MAISFKSAVKKAKGLYKSGHYKKFSDAVAAAYKKGKTVVRKARAVSKKRRSIKRRVSGVDPIIRTKPTPLTIAKAKLAKALLDHRLEKTISGTKEAARRIKKWSAEVKRLSK